MQAHLFAPPILSSFCICVREPSPESQEKAICLAHVTDTEHPQEKPLTNEQGSQCINTLVFPLFSEKTQRCVLQPLKGSSTGLNPSCSQ